MNSQVDPLKNRPSFALDIQFSESHPVVNQMIQEKLRVPESVPDVLKQRLWRCQYRLYTFVAQHEAWKLRVESDKDAEKEMLKDKICHLENLMIKTTERQKLILADIHRSVEKAAASLAVSEKRKSLELIGDFDDGKFDGDSRVARGYVRDASEFNFQPLSFGEEESLRCDEKKNEEFMRTETELANASKAQFLLNLNLLTPELYEKVLIHKKRWKKKVCRLRDLFYVPPTETEKRHKLILRPQSLARLPKLRSMSRRKKSKSLL